MHGVVGHPLSLDNFTSRVIVRSDLSLYFGLESLQSNSISARVVESFVAELVSFLRLQNQSVPSCSGNTFIRRIPTILTNMFIYVLLILGNNGERVCTK